MELEGSALDCTGVLRLYSAAAATASWRSRCILEQEREVKELPDMRDLDKDQ